MFLKRMKIDKKWNNNPWVMFLPFLLLYLVISIVFSSNTLEGDQARYLNFANNLLNGFYSPPLPEMSLWNGPGYPLILSVFLFLKLPLLLIKLFNAVLLYSSLVISFKTLLRYTSKKQAMFYVVLLGLYFPVFQMLPLILTECLAWFLISLITYWFTKNYSAKEIRLKHILQTSLALTFLALTKVIFGYVLLCMLVVSLLLFLVPKYRSAAKKSSLIFMFSLVFCLPYLLYTYSLTNQVFYWADSGSMSLYTLSSPHEDELGDWYRLRTNSANEVFIDSIYKLSPLERDAAFKAKAIENIKTHPKKYFKNWTANVGRLLFSYPFSYENQTMKTYFTIVPNMFVIVFILLSAFISFIRFKSIPVEILLLLLFILIYLGGSSLVSAYRRMFYISLPFWILFVSYAFTNIVSIKMKKP